MSKNNTIRVGVILIRDDKVLLTRINRDKNLTYVLPGGSLESREDIFQAAKREVREETNLEINNLKLKYIKELYTEDDEHGIEFIFLADIVGGELKLGYDPEYEDDPVLDEVKFFPFEELEKMNFHPKQLISYLKNYKEDSNESLIHLGLFKYPEE